MKVGVGLLEVVIVDTRRESEITKGESEEYGFAVGLGRIAFFSLESWPVPRVEVSEIAKVGIGEKAEGSMSSAVTR